MVERVAAAAAAAAAASCGMVEAMYWGEVGRQVELARLDQCNAATARRLHDDSPACIAREIRDVRRETGPRVFFTARR